MNIQLTQKIQRFKRQVEFFDDKVKKIDSDLVCVTNLIKFVTQTKILSDGIYPG